MVHCKLVAQQALIYVAAFTVFLTSVYHRRHFVYFSKNETLLDQFDINCNGLFEGDKEAIKELKSWTISKRLRGAIEKQISYHSTNCDFYRKLLGLSKKPLSKEEEEFPLAYGMLVYKDFMQVLLMFAGFYQPQNQYCIAVSGQADGVFRRIMGSLENCFPNIHILDRPPVVWGGHEIMNSTYACFEYLVKAEKPWKYYQYLSGVDLPLRTNLEMVKILKVFNGSANMDVHPFEKYRLVGKNIKTAPLPLFKSSVSVMIPREAAVRIVQSAVTKSLLDYLDGTWNSDETFWTTLMGNKKRFPLPGAFEASELIKFREKYARKHKDAADIYREQFTRHDTSKINYYVHRMHVWDSAPDVCRGKFVLFSCVFGVDDIVDVLRQPHFVAHKFYMDFEPAALICGLKKIRQKAAKLTTKINETLYSELPMVELNNGIPLGKLKHPLWLLGATFR